LDKEKEKILNYCREKFLSEGFYKTTMDEIASDIRISKKTIYKHFTSKDELAKQIITEFLNEIQIKMTKIMSSKKDALSKFLEIINFVAGMITKMSFQFLTDIQTHYPDLWLQIDKFRTEKMIANITKIFHQGKPENVFIDYPPEIVRTIFISGARSIINPQFIIQNKFSINEALEITIDILMNGILTSKGKKLYKKIKTERRNEN
jgi:AcrR family transcriptional regulator